MRRFVCARTHIIRILICVLGMEGEKSGARPQRCYFDRPSVNISPGDAWHPTLDLARVVLTLRAHICVWERENDTEFALALEKCNKCRFRLSRETDSVTPLRRVSPRHFLCLAVGSTTTSKRGDERVNILVLGRKVKIFDLGVKQKGSSASASPLYLLWGKSLRSGMWRCDLLTPLDMHPRKS